MRDVVAALERAVRYGAFSLAAIQRILAVRSPAPRHLGDVGRRAAARIWTPWLDSEPVSPRPTSDYQALLGEESRDVEATDPDEDHQPRMSRAV